MPSFERCATPSCPGYLGSCEGLPGGEPKGRQVKEVVEAAALESVW